MAAATFAPNTSTPTAGQPGWVDPISAGAPASTGGTQPGASTASPVITADSLTQNPTPAAVPVLPPSTAAPALAGALDTTQQTWQQQLDQATQSASTAKDTSLHDLLLASATGGQATFQNQAYQAAGIDKLQSDLTAASTQMTNEQQNLSNTIQNLKKNPAGFTSAGLQDEITRLTSKSLQNQANIAVKQLAANGLLTDAKAVADRAVAMQLEQRTNQINVLQAVYNDNKNIFTTAEQQQFQAAQAERNSQLAITAQQLEAQSDEKIKQSDPYYLAQTANENAQARLNSSNADFIAGLTGGAPSAGGTDLSTNPGSIKLGAATQHWVDQGLATVSPNTAADGGHFLIFKDLATGIQAQKELLFGPNYSGLTVSQALSKWSNGGYDGSIVPSIANKPMSTLTPAEQNYLITTQMAHEGTSSPSAYKQSLATSTSFPGNPQTAPAADLLNYAVQRGNLLATDLNANRGNVAKLATYVNVLRSNPDYSFVNAAANAAGAKTAATTQAKTSTQLQQSAGTVLRHLPQVAADLKGLTRTGIPGVNSLLNSVGRFASPDTKKYLSDLSVLRGEISNVLAAQGVPTDKARGEAENILPDNLNYNDFLKTIGDVSTGTGLLNLMQEKINQYGQPVDLIHQPTSTGDSFKPL